MPHFQSGCNHIVRVGGVYGCGWVSVGRLVPGWSPAGMFAGEMIKFLLNLFIIISN